MHNIHIRHEQARRKISKREIHENCDDVQSRVHVMLYAVGREIRLVMFHI